MDLSITLRRQAKMKAVIAARNPSLHCALESVHHRHNVSAILRTCDSLGLHNIHLIQQEGKFKAVKGAARGAERWLDITHHQDPALAIKSMQDQGLRVYVADIDEHAISPRELPVDQPLCVWMGAELIGVSPQALQQADGVVALPMRGFSQSLNVSVAAAMILNTVSENMRRQHPELCALSTDEQTALLQRWHAREDVVLKHIKRQPQP